MSSGTVYQDRLRGCVLGAAVGDALGMPLEFRARSADHALVRDMQAGRLAAGHFTDDTEMALALAESLLAHKPLDPEDLAGRFLAWYLAHPADVGIQTGAVLARIKAGESWDKAATKVHHADPEAASNGSLMRAWPVAIAHHDQPEDILVDSYRQSYVTHAHRDCLSASAFVCATIFHLIHGTPLDHATVLASTVVHMADALWQVIEEAPSKTRADLPNSGWVHHTLASAIWAVSTTDSFEEAVIQAANLGGDADTAASVAGALAGAQYGLSAIPERWLDHLHGEWPLGSGTIWKAKQLIDLADRLAEGGQPE